MPLFQQNVSEFSPLNMSKWNLKETIKRKETEKNPCEIITNKWPSETFIRMLHTSLRKKNRGSSVWWNNILIERCIQSLKGSFCLDGPQNLQFIRPNFCAAFANFVLNFRNQLNFDLLNEQIIACKLHKYNNYLINPIVLCNGL